MSSKIQVPVAFSDYKNNLFAFAVEKAGKTNADLISVPVLEEKETQAMRNFTSY